MKFLFLSGNRPPVRNAPDMRLYERAIRWVRGGRGASVASFAQDQWVGAIVFNQLTTGAQLRS